MLDKLKAAVRRTWAAGKASIWTLLLLAFPYADQLVQLLEANLPVLAPYLPPNVFKLVGFIIVAVKFGLQIVALVKKVNVPQGSGS
jgi:hypothetical protein